MSYLREVKMNKEKEDKKSQPDKPSAASVEEPKKAADSSKASIPAAGGAKKASDGAEKKEISPADSEVKTSASDKKPEETSDSDKKEEAASSASDSKVAAPAKEEVKLSGLYAFKLAMSSIYDEKGRFTPVTFLEVKPWVVSQVKKVEKEGYNSVQVACMPQKNNRCSKALKTHLSSTGFTEGARYGREIRQDSVENVKVGQPVSIHSIQKGGRVKVQSVSKGHGFAGVVKRWGFKGGPASHGAKTHRTSGSIGNRTEPARVMPGKKMAGHYGVEKVSLRSVQVMDVVEDKNLIVLKGPVPGARNSLVFLQSMK